MKYEDLLNTLEPLFNTAKIKLQTTSDFANTVRSACEKATSAQELFDILDSERARVVRLFEDNSKTLEEGFYHRKVKSLTRTQETSIIIMLIHNRKVESTLHVLRAFQRAHDDSDEDLLSVYMQDMAYGLNIPKTPVDCAVEELPSSPTSGTGSSPAHGAALEVELTSLKDAISVQARDNIESPSTPSINQETQNIASPLSSAEPTSASTSQNPKSTCLPSTWPKGCDLSHSKIHHTTPEPNSVLESGSTLPNPKKRRRDDRPSTDDERLDPPQAKRAK